MLCLGGLRAAGKLSASMVASLMLQFLPILAQRAHRKQEKLNRVGEQQRELLLPMLHRMSVQLESIKEASSVKPHLDAFISGAETTKLGDSIASLFKIFATLESKAEVAQLIKGVSEELLDLLPRLFPASLHGAEVPMSVHRGSRCACCNAEPIEGPRFRSASDGIDICGECFIDHAFDASRNFECHLTAEDADPWEVFQNHRDHMCRQWVEFVNGCGSNNWWHGVPSSESAAGDQGAFDTFWKAAAGKGKGKGKGKTKENGHKCKGIGKAHWHLFGCRRPRGGPFKMAGDQERNWASATMHSPGCAIPPEFSAWMGGLHPDPNVDTWQSDNSGRSTGAGASAAAHWRPGA